MRSARRRLGRRGFSFVELLLVLSLGTVVAAALYQVVRFQQRVYRQESEAIARHDALRLASSVLAADLMEASGREGDFTALAPDSIVVRSPVGFGVVCDTDNSDRRVGLFGTSGRFSASDGDSLLVYTPGGWLVMAIQAVNPSSAGSLNCPYAGGPALELTLRVDQSVANVPVGAPVRTFHVYAYRLKQDRGAWWLARSDASSTEEDILDILVGPFSDDGAGLAFAYFDAFGQSTADATQVTRVDLSLVAVSGGSTGRDTLTTSVRPRNQ
jgi:prepilin-type N-terminal cleavage/methylation domain-containing protein